MPSSDPITILLVDDEEMVLTSIRSFLAIETDYKVVTFTSPVKALQELDRIGADLVISDYLMPDMDGITFLGKVKEKYAWPKIIPKLLDVYAEVLQSDSSRS